MSEHEGADGESSPLSAAQLRAVFDVVDDALFVHDATGTTVAVNRTAVEMYGYSRTELERHGVGLACSDDPPYTRENAIERVERAARGDTGTFEWEARDADGDVFWVEVTLDRTVVDGEALVLAVVRNVDDRKEVERRFQTLIDNLPGVVYRCEDAAGWPMRFVGGQCRELTGYSAAAIEEGAVGWEADLVHPDDRDRIRREVRAATADGDAFELTYRIRTASGEERRVWERGRRVEAPGSECELLEGFVTDVTERREYERKLRRFRRAVEAAGHAIYMTTPDGTITYVNPAFERITGYDREEAVGSTPGILRSDEMSAEYYADLWATISAGDVWEEAIRDRRKSGELYYAHQTIAPLVGDDGDVEAYVAIQTDVTGQREREARLHQYERAVEGSTELIAAIDADYRYLFANQAYREFHGLSEDSVRRKRLPEVLGDETFERIESYVERVLAGRTVTYRMTRERPKRSDRTFQIRYSPLTDDGGEVRGAVATMRDVTDRVERERHLVALDRLLRHNLRNELNVVRGRAETIARRGDDDVADQAAVVDAAAERILRQAEKEREVVELLVEPTTLRPLDLATVVEDAAEPVTADRPEATIAVEVPEGLAVTAVPELGYGVRELIENAVDHSDRESPRVEVTARRRDGAVELRIADDGPGIPPQERDVVAEGSDIDPLAHSSGMGLWLVKRIVNRTDGSLRFEDRDPRGSVVSVVLPPREDPTGGPTS